MALSPRAVTAVLRSSRRPARLVAFYRDVLGLPLEPVRTPGFPPHHGCELGYVYFAVLRSAQKSGSSTCVAFLVDDVVAASAALRAAGVAQVHPPKRTAMGLISRFLDPDENPFELYQP